MSWLHRILGRDGTTQLGVESTHFAAKVAGRPMHLGSRGAYCWAGVSGVVAAGLAGNSEIFQARWIDATRKMILRSLRFSAGRGTTAFTAGSFSITGTVARTWTVDGSGGTAIVFSTNNTNKKRADFVFSLFSDTGVRIASTAALGVGTKTFDTNPFAAITSFVSSAATTAADNPMVAPGTSLWERSTHEEYPFLLEQNEGLVIRATVPATGTWQFTVQMEWDEIDPAEVEGWT